MRRRNAVVLCAERGSEGVTFDCQLFSSKAERRRRLDSEIGFLATSYQIKETQNRLWCSLRACLQALSGSARTSLGQSWGALGRPWVAMESYKTDLESFLSALGRAKALPIAIWTCPGAHFWWMSRTKSLFSKDARENTKPQLISFEYPFPPKCSRFGCGGGTIRGGREITPSTPNTNSIKKQ